MEEIELSRWLFEGRLRQGKNLLPDGLNWLCYFAGNSKSHRDNSISFIFLESPHQVDMKNVVKSSKQFFGYFNTLETHSETFHRFFYKTFQDKLEHLDLIEGVVVDLLQTKWKSFIKKNFFIQMAMYSVYFVISLFVFVSR